MRVQIVDPPAYTPPYDRSLCAALARHGADVELVTSRFDTAPSPRRGYRVTELFYRRSATRPARSASRRLKGGEHLAGMLRYRRRPRSADVVHYQWLPLPALDSRLLAQVRPRVMTAHGVLREEAFERRLARGLAGCSSGWTLSSRFRSTGRDACGNPALSPSGPGDPARRVRLPHPAAERGRRSPASSRRSSGPGDSVLRLVRPYKGVDVLLDAFRELEGAELWVVGRPLGMSLDGLRAPRPRGRVAECASCPGSWPTPSPRLTSRADLVVLPYRDAEQSGCCSPRSLSARRS